MADNGKTTDPQTRRDLGFDFGLGENVEALIEGGTGLVEDALSFVAGPGGILEQQTNAIRGFVGTLGNTNVTNDASIPSGMVFPAALNTITSNRPVLELKCIGGANNGKKAVFPCPVGFGVTDGASYNDTELGTVGQTAKNMTQSFLGMEKGSTSNFPGNLGEAYRDESRATAAGKGAGAAVLLGLALGKDKIPTEFLQSAARGVSIATGIALNKNVTTEFTGVGTRAFSFQYKLTPMSQEESFVIDNVIRFLRQGIYPAGEETTGGVVLRYPPRWKLEFNKRINGARLPTVPAIAECYLESFATTYNGSNAFHDDGVPVDTDITLNFKESRSLTREDIKKLEETGSLN